MEEVNNRPYCLIRRGVVLNNRTLFECKQKDGDSGALLSEIYREMGIQYPKFHKMDNLAKIGFLAAEILLRNTPLDTPEPKRSTGVILMNGSSSIDTDSHFQGTIADPENFFPSPSLFVYTLPNIVVGEICIRFKIQGEGVVFESPSFDANHIYLYLSQLFNNNILKDSLFGWVDFRDQHHEAFMAYITKERFHLMDAKSFLTFTDSIVLS